MARFQILHTIFLKRLTDHAVRSNGFCEFLSSNGYGSYVDFSILIKAMVESYLIYSNSVYNYIGGALNRLVRGISFECFMQAGFSLR